MGNIGQELILMNIGMKMIDFSMIKEITHNGQTCIFNGKYHSYRMKGTGQKLTGVTTFIKQFFPKFDTDQVALDVGRKRGVCPNELKKEWKTKGQQASLDGDNVHEYSEYIFGNGKVVNPINERTEKIFAQLVNVASEFKKKGYIPFATEKIIFSSSLGLSGTIDLIMTKQPDGIFLIIDFKTSEEMLIYNPFQNAFKPINHLEDANLTHYSLQLNLYQYILETEKYFDFEPDITFKKIIIHLTENSFVPYACKDMKSEIESMLI